MFYRRFVFLFSFAAVLFAESDFVPTFENDPSALIEGRVNALTGRLSVYEEDLVIQGAEPIRISRVYIDGPKGEWRFAIDFAKIIDTDKPYRWVVWEKDRCPILYKKLDTVKIDGATYIRCEPSSLEKGFSNTARGEISSRTNLKNNRVFIDEKFKFLIVHSADGTVRNYKKIHHSDKDYRLLSEQLPNGNWVLYDYKEIEIDSDRVQFLLASIRTTNPAQDKTYARADFRYEDPKRKNKHVHIVGSDGQSIEYFSPLQEKLLGPLEKIFSSSAPDQQFQYLHYRNSYEKYKGNYTGAEQHRLQALVFPLNRQIRFDYYKKEYEEIPGQKIHLNEDDWYRGMVDDPRRDCVKTIAIPLGRDPNPQITYSLVYEPSSNGKPYFSKTSVYDIDGNRTDYFSDSYTRLKQIERYSKDGKRLNGEKYEWGYSGDLTGCLIRKTHLDADLKPLCFTRYVYDNRGNILEKRFCGNLSGSGPPISIDVYGDPIDGQVETHSIKYRYSQSEPNLLLEEQHDSGLRIVYDYLPGTDLPLARFIYDRERLQFRHFFEYNSDRILIREVEDDGSSLDPDDFSEVAVRTIRSIIPLDSGPFIGLPHIVEEKYWERGEERLLKKTVFTYTTGGKIAKKEVYDAEGEFLYALETKYDGKERPVEQTNPMGQAEILSYDLCGNLIARCDFAGKTYVNDYDLSNLPIAATQEGAIRLRSLFSYDKKRNLVCETDPRGHATRRRYDALGRCLETQFPETPTEAGALVFSSTCQEYDSMDNPILKIDAEGNQTRISYNSYGKPILVVYPDGAQEKYAYFLDGQLKTHIDPEGVSTSYTYDFLGRLLRKTGAGSEESFSYKGNCLVSKTDAEGFVTTYQYDGAGRKISEEQNGETTLFFYDSLGRLRKTQKGDLISIAEYDLLDRIIEERSESVSGDLLRLVDYEYDEAGNQTAMIRSIAGEVSIERKRYDSLDRLIERTDPLGHREIISYDDFFENHFGQKVLRKTRIDPLGLQTIEIFDARDQLAKTEKFKGQTLSTQEKIYNKNGLPILQIDKIPSRQIALRWTYDSRNRLRSLVEPHLKTTYYNYTPCGRLSQIVKPSGIRLFYTYNDLGFLTSLTSSDGTVRHCMEYDLCGRLIFVDGTSRTLDGKGRILQENFSHGLSIQNSYDEQGRCVESKIPAANCLIGSVYNPTDLVSVSRKTLDGQLLYTHNYISHDLSGNLLEQNLIGDLGSIHYSIDPLSRKMQIAAPQFSQQILELDPMGNILRMRLQNELLSYTYDDLYQLTSESNHQYTHDAHYNRLQKNSENYTINDLNQIVSHFEYDLNGNPIRHNDTIYTYDALDRLVRIQTPDQIQTFAYDFLNRRLSKTINSQITYFLYDGQNEIGAFDESLTPLELRILGYAPHAEIGAAIAIELENKPYAPIHDLQGNVAALLPLDHGPSTFYGYTAFGEEHVSGSARNPWRFSSKRTDETGLVYFGRRFYDPTLGRWLTPDPAGFADGINLYAYVHNDPLIHVDEYGLLAYHYINGWQNTPWNSEFSWATPQNFIKSPEKRGQHTARVCIGIDPYGGRSPNYYVNGILNTRKDSRHGASTLLKTFDSKANIVAFYSESFGLIGDFLSVRKSINDPNYTNSSIRRLNRELSFQTTSLEAMNDLRKIFVTGFSRGGAVIFHGSKNLTTQQRNRLIITACGPIMILPKELGFSVTNLISEGDWCSSYCTGVKKYLDHYKQYANVKILEQKDGFSGLIRDHFFESKTYQEGIKEECVRKHKQYGLLK